MSKFKVGDTVIRIRDKSKMLPVGTECQVWWADQDEDQVIMIKRSGDILFSSNFELKTPQIPKGFNCRCVTIKLNQYPNPPRPHMHERIEYAKGADIQWIYQNLCYSKEWSDCSGEPEWNDSINYRVKPAHSPKEIKIAKPEAKLVKLRSEL